MTEPEKQTDKTDAMVALFRAYKIAKEEFFEEPSVLLNALTALLGGEIMCLHDAGMRAKQPDFSEACANAMKALQDGPIGLFVDRLQDADGGAAVFERAYRRCLAEIEHSSILEVEIDKQGNLKTEHTTHHDVVH